jgi:hypothetical protein
MSASVGSAATSVGFATAAVESRAGSVFRSAVVWGLAGVTLAVAGFIGVKVIVGAFVALWQWPVIAIVGIVAIVDVAIEAVRPMEPGTCAEEDSANKPIRTVIAVWGAIIGCVIEISVGTDRGGANVDSYRNLSRGNRSCAHERAAKNQESNFTSERHHFLLFSLIKRVKEALELCLRQGGRALISSSARRELD